MQVRVHPPPSETTRPNRHPPPRVPDAPARSATSASDRPPHPPLSSDTHLRSNLCSTLEQGSDSPLSTTIRPLDPKYHQPAAVDGQPNARNPGRRRTSAMSELSLPRKRLSAISRQAPSPRSRPRVESKSS